MTSIRASEPAGGVFIPPAMVDDVVLKLQEALAMQAAWEAIPRDSVSWEERQALEATARATAAAAALPGLDPAVAADIVEAIHEELEAADGEGLGAPYDEAAISTAVYVVDKLARAEEEVRKATEDEGY